MPCSRCRGTCSRSRRKPTSHAKTCCIPGPSGPPGQPGPLALTYRNTVRNEAIGYTLDPNFVIVPGFPNDATLSLPSGTWFVWFSISFFVSAPTSQGNVQFRMLQGALNDTVPGFQGPREVSFPASDETPWFIATAMQGLVTETSVSIFWSAFPPISGGINSWTLSALRLGP